MKLWVVILFLLLLVGFNLSYLSNSGLLVVGLKNARRITYRNAHLHSKSVSNNISTFRMEPFMTQQECYNIAAVVYAMTVVLNDPRYKNTVVWFSVFSILTLMLNTATSINAFMVIFDFSQGLFEILNVPKEEIELRKQRRIELD